MYFEDEPVPGFSLPILPGHVSPGRLERVLRARQFAVTAEIAPPDSADAREVRARAKVFDGYVDAINATDGSGANCHMSSVGVCSLLTRLGYAMVMQVSCRDRNRIDIQGDVLGAAAMGVANILCLTGDGVQAGDHPQARPVFDLDAVSLASTVKVMRDESRFLSGRKLLQPPRVMIGGAANPFVPPYDYRALRLKKKIEAGVEFVQTQYCFDVPRLREYMAQVRDMGLHERAFMLIGVGPLASARAAAWIRDHVPGIHIPDSVITRLRGAQNQRNEGIRLCVELAQEIREIEGVAGVHIMAYRQEDSVAEIIDRAGILQGRVPWYPGRDREAPASREANRGH